MTKSIPIILADKTYIIKVDRFLNNKIDGLSIMIFCDNENSKPAQVHYLDFKKHPANEIESNIFKFFNGFGKDEACEWLYGYINNLI